MVPLVSWAYCVAHGDGFLLMSATMGATMGKDFLGGHLVASVFSLDHRIVSAESQKAARVVFVCNRWT